VTDREAIEREIEDCAACERIGGLCRQHRAELEQLDDDEDYELGGEA